jgi:hypothetical protein
MQRDKLISVNVSAGELVDKITILEIKASRLADAEKCRHVRQELEMLHTVRDRALEPSPPLTELSDELKYINLELWRIEDEIRLHEQKKDFGPEFIELARAVYRSNDRRSELKRQINALLGSALVEEKSYPAYQ